MTSDAFSDDLKRFITTNLNSVEQLEILLALSAEPARAWSPQELAKQLYTQPDSAAMRLADLLAKKLCVRVEAGSPQYRYRSGDPRQDTLIRELAEAYRVRRVAVIEMIFSQPRDSISMFSDAFRLRRDD